MTSWPTPLESSSKPTELSVLLTEDDAEVAKYLTTVLRTLGHRVVGIAQNGGRAIELARDLVPDLIIMDIDLPEMNGVEAAARILENTSVPVIMCTGRSDYEALESTRQLEVQAYLNKPFSAVQLRSAIVIALSQHQRQIEARRKISELRVALEKGVQAHEATRLSVERLQTLKLTKREAEVLFWIGQGKSNADIAAIHKTSPRTVAKHVEHIFGKLSVESRTAAIAEARRRLQLG